MPEIGRLLDALKATPSPVDSSVSMFETTHVVITSEMSRANRNDAGNPDTKDGASGTPHWPWTQAAIFGGSFKRGYAYGRLDGDLEGVRTNPTTGALNEGEIPTVKNLFATLMKANGVDPKGWTSAGPSGRRPQKVRLVSPARPSERSSPLSPHEGVHRWAASSPGQTKTAQTSHPRLSAAQDRRQSAVSQAQGSSVPSSAAGPTVTRS